MKVLCDFLFYDYGPIQITPSIDPVLDIQTGFLQRRQTQNFLGSNFLCAKLSGRSVRKRFSGQALLPLILPKMNVLAPLPLTESQQISPNRAKNGVGVLNKTHGKLCRSL